MRQSSVAELHSVLACFSSVGSFARAVTLLSQTVGERLLVHRCRRRSLLKRSREEAIIFLRGGVQYYRAGQAEPHDAGRQALQRAVAMDGRAPEENVVEVASAEVKLRLQL